MRRFPDTLADLLETPFLSTPDWERFCQRLEQVVSVMGEGESVLCAEKDPVETLAVFFAVLLRKGGVFLANPNWQEIEWEQVQALTGFDKVFGCESIEADPSRAVTFAEARIMIASGGTSGGVRFCVHSSNTLLSAVESLSQFHGRKPLNSINSLPVFHVSGLMPILRAFFTGGVVHLAHWKAIESGDFPKRPGASTSMSLVPTQLARLLKSEEGIAFLHGLHTIYIGGAATSPELVSRIRSEKLPVIFVYGMTETAAMVLYGTRGDTDEAGAIWGQPLPGVSVRLTEDQGISIKTRALFRGYFPDDSSIQEFQTGDIGRWVTNELLQVLGRKDFLINTGGEKVNPEEVEAVLARYVPDGEVAISSLPDKEWGEILVAVFEAEYSPKMIATIEKQLSQSLAPHKIPKRFMSGVAIPRSTLGKIIRSRLRTLLLSLSEE